MTAPITDTIPDTTNIATDPKTSTVPITNTAVDNTIESEQDRNWKKFREQKEQDRRAREAAEKLAQEERAKAEALKAAMEALVNKPQPQQQQYGSEDSDQERIDKAVAMAIAKKEAEAERIRRERELQEYPKKLLQDYPDFNHVTTQEHLDYLEYHYPELVRPFASMPEGYDKWANLYKTVKKLVPNLNAKNDSKKAENNLKKPQAVTPPGSAPSGTNASPTYLSDAQKQANWERMQRTLKGLD